MTILQRIADWCHERRIQRLGRELALGDQLCRSERTSLWQRYAQAINARPPEQVARMEKARGLR